MSNLVCPVCGSSYIQTERRPDGFHHCMECWYRWAIGVSQQKQTVFDKITESVEALANELVYWEQNPPNSGWTSSLIRRGGYKTYRTKSEAISATVVELKKEWKSGKDNDVPANDTDNNVGSMEKR